MKSVLSPVERAIVLCAAILLVLLVDYLKPASSPMIRLELTVLGAERKPDQAVEVTAVIVNRGEYTLADNRLFVVPGEEGGVFHTSPDGRNSGSGTVTADDPPGDLPVRVLEGAFDEIPPNRSATIAFTVPSDISRREPLYIIFQSLKIRYDNIEEPRIIRFTEPLTIPE